MVLGSEGALPATTTPFAGGEPPLPGHLAMARCHRWPKEFQMKTRSPSKIPMRCDHADASMCLTATLEAMSSAKARMTAGEPPPQPPTARRTSTGGHGGMAPSATIRGIATSSRHFSSSHKPEACMACATALATSAVSGTRLAARRSSSMAVRSSPSRAQSSATVRMREATASAAASVAGMTVATAAAAGAPTDAEDASPAAAAESPAASPAAAAESASCHVAS